MPSSKTATAVTTSVDVSTPASDRMVTYLLLCAGHFFVDLYSSALAAFQPILAAKLGLSLTQAGLLGGVQSFSSSLTQPAYGYISDRVRSRFFTVLAPAIAGLFISALGLATSFYWACAMMLLGGAGVAAFHPQASVRAIASFQKHRGQWMAIFISAGTLGFALGPTFFSQVAQFWGVERTWLAAIPGVLATALLWRFFPSAPSGPLHRQPFDRSALREKWQPLTILYFTVVVRSIVQICFTQFLPLYLSTVRGYSLSRASFVLTLFLSSGAVGGFLGGRLSDRIGGRAVILLSMLACLPFFGGFFLTNGWFSVACLMLGGLLLLFTIPVNVVMAQELVPSQAATISAMMQGFAWGMAGMIFVPLAGWFSDLTSLQTALSATLVFPVIGFLLTLKLAK